MSAEGTEVVTLNQLKMLAKAISETVGMTRGGAVQYAYWKSTDIKDENDATDVPMTVSSFGCNAPIQQDGNGFVFSLGGFYHFEYEATVSSDVRSYSGSGMNVKVTADLSVGGKSALSAAKTVNVETIEDAKETVSGSGEVFVEAGQRVELGVKFSKRTGLSYCDYYPILNSASLTIKLAQSSQEVTGGASVLYSSASGAKKVTLSETAANFIVLIIRIKLDSGYVPSFTVIASGGESVTLQYNDDYTRVKVSGTNVSLDTTSPFHICKVVGIR